MVVDSLVVVVVVVTVVLLVVDVNGLQRDRPNKLKDESIESEIGLVFREGLLVLTKSGLFSDLIPEKSPQVLDISFDLEFHKLLANESFHKVLD